jgi:hypothetical protein
MQRATARTSVIASVGLLLGVLLGGAVTLAIRGTSNPSAAAEAAAVPTNFTPSAAPSAGAADGEDPVAAHCAADAVLVDKMPVFISGKQVGALELKYSKFCGAGWARLYLYPGQPLMLGAVSVASADGRSSAFTDPLVHQVPVYTDVIVPGVGGCLSASATVYDSGQPPAQAALPCQAPS